MKTSVLPIFQLSVKPLSLPCLLSQSTSWAHGGTHETICVATGQHVEYSINGLKFFLFVFKHSKQQPLH